MSVVCVGRETELSKLTHFLKKSASGNFQICFIVGEAGSGKTTLINGFIDNIVKIFPEAIVAFGECDAQFGISDPYLPFKEILSMLAGDMDEKLTRRRSPKQMTKKLGNIVTTSIETIIENGPDLIGSIVPGGVIIAIALKVFSEKSGVLKKIRDRINNPIKTEINQATIFQEYTNVLRKLAEKRPLIIVLDDLHWADNASVALLFHLTRKLGASKIVTAQATETKEGKKGVPARARRKTSRVRCLFLRAVEM